MLFRSLEDCMQTVRVSTPCVIAVLPEACEAPIPGMKAILAAGKKPSKIVSFEDLNIDGVAADSKTELTGYANQRSGIRIEGTPEEMAAELKKSLVKEGLL